MTTPDARLARVETVLADLQGDIAELKQETMRTRSRLHDSEGMLGALVEQEKFRRQATRERDKKIGMRLQILIGVTAVAALVEPFLYHIAGGN